jgi:hypothetical protein
MIKLITQYGEFNGVGDDSIVLTRAANNLTDLQSRQGDFTEVFELLPTHNNLTILESANEPTSTSNRPYQNIQGLIETDGEQIEGLYQVLSIGERIRIRFLSGNADFWQITSNKKLRDLNLSDLNHQWLINNIVNSLTATDGYKYTANDYGGSYPANDTITAQRMLPSVFVHTIIDRIVQEADYTKTGTVFNESEYLSLLQDLCSENLVGILPVDGEANRTTNINQLALGSYLIGGIIRVYLLQFDNIVSGGFSSSVTIPQGTFTVTAYDIITPTYYNIRLKLIINFSSFAPQGGFVDYGIRLMRTGVIGTQVVQFIQFNPLPNLGLNIYDIDIDFPDLLFVGERIYFELVVPEFSVFQIFANSEFIVSPVQDAEIQYGGDWDIAANLPDVTQAEYFKQVGLLFGWQLETDIFNKEIKAYKFDDLKNTQAIDLTDRIDYTEKPTVEFEFGNYAQINDMVYKDAEGVEKPTGTDFVFNIQNEKLPSRATVIQSIWGATESRTTGFLGFPTSRIRKFDTDIKPIHRILIDRQITAALTITDGNINPDANITSISTPYFLDLTESFNLGWAFLAASYYGLQIETLQKMKFVKMLMYLTPYRFKTLRFDQPIYADGSTYYLNEVSQFNLTKKESTFVELIKLPI